MASADGRAASQPVPVFSYMGDAAMQKRGGQWCQNSRNKKTDIGKGDIVAAEPNGKQPA